VTRARENEIETGAQAALGGRARTGGPGDAIVGVIPARVVEPANLDQAAAAIAAGARDRHRLAFVGGGTELGLGAAPEGLELVLRTAGLDRVVEHAPLDQIVTVECGVRLAGLQEILARHGQMLAIDPPWAERATMGGIVASAAFGARRSRYGSVRDLIIGLSLIRADGTRARAGGKVVKNVAGFDLPKLLTGSLGTLGFIATATFRLHPLPEASATLVLASGAAADVRRIVTAARAAQLEPDAVAVLIDPGRAHGRDRDDGGPARDGRPDDGWQLGVRFAGFPRAVEQQRDRLRVVGRDLGLGFEPRDDQPGAGFWQRHGAAREAPARFRAKVALLPADPAAAEIFARLCAPLRDPRAVFYPTLGLGFVAGDPDSPEAGAGNGTGTDGDVGARVAAVVAGAHAIAAAVDQARVQLAPSGGSVVVHEAPASVRALLDVWGAPPALRSAIPLMRSVKARLDPDRRLAPGRFIGGI
jgi:glycolate oxidase FAD binding subunit